MGVRTTGIFTLVHNADSFEPHDRCNTCAAPTLALSIQKCNCKTYSPPRLIRRITWIFSLIKIRSAENMLASALPVMVPDVTY
jgi:hypothetical protein